MMKNSTILKICTWSVLIFMLLCFTLILLIGCTGTLGKFESEEYIWEHWTISTNSVEVITSGQ